MTEKQKPSIRFKGFTEYWEQRKLGEVAKYRNGKAHENDISEQGKYVVVNSKFVSTNGEVRKFSNKQKEPLFKNEIAFVLSDVPNGRAIARTFLVDKDDKYTLNQRIAGITPTENICPYYLHILMNRNKYFLQFDDGAKQTNLSITDVMEFEEYYPSSKEQYKVGAYFEIFDTLIALYQRKHDKLVNIKKSMLEKMFPKNDANVPEIRFNGFNNNWKPQKLGEIVERVIRKNINNESSLPLTISAQYGLVDQITYFNNRVASQDISNYYLVLNGDFAYNKSTSDGFPFGAVKRLDLYEKGVLSTLYIVFSIKNQNETNSDFLKVFFDTNRWHKGVAERATEGARNHGLLNISVEDFFEIDLFLPGTEEQTVIGEYFCNIDKLIALQQQKLKKLQNMKKACLEKMFV